SETRASNSTGSGRASSTTTPAGMVRPIRSPTGHSNVLASSSARRRSRPQYVPENAGLHLECPRAVVLIVSGGHRDHELELRDDADGLPASTERGSPVDLAPVEQGAAEPPEIAIEIETRGVHPRCHRGVDPCFRNDLAVVPATAREDELADFRHVAR